jgi:hypothetical protein
MVIFSIAMVTVCTSGLADDPFRKASPAECDLSAEALELLSEHIGGFVEKEAVIRAEVHVIKDRKTVLHRAYGWADREERRRSEIARFTAFDR